MPVRDEPVDSQVGYGSFEKIFSPSRITFILHRFVKKSREISPCINFHTSSCENQLMCSLGRSSVLLWHIHRTCEEIQYP